MAASRAERRAARAARAAELFPSQADAALDLLELTDSAWHDCFGGATPPDDVVEDIWAVSRGDLAVLIRAAKLAVTDFRDLRLWADEVRGR